MGAELATSTNSGKTRHPYPCPWYGCGRQSVLAVISDFYKLRGTDPMHDIYMSSVDDDDFVAWEHVAELQV